MRLLREVGRSVSWSTWNPVLLCLATKAALLRRAGKGSALRELSHSVLEELFEDEICVPERYKGYALARESSQSEVERLQGPGISWSEGLDPPPPDALLSQLSRRINQRLATRCQEVADGVGVAELYGMFRYVAERGEEHKAQLCPPGSVPSGSIIVRLTTSPVPPLVARQDTTSVGTLKASATRFTTCCHDSQGNAHCDADGSYSTVRGFAHALCKSELKDCDDTQRPDPNMGEPTAATARGARDL
jgi:hypothetical protein